MKFSLIKDLSLTCLIMTTDIIYSPLPIFLPYLYSYLKNLDETITFSWCYSVLVFLYLGSFLANTVLPNCFIIFGIKKTFIIGGIIYFLNSLFFVLYPNRVTVLIYGVVGGVSFNFKTLPTNYYLCAKYSDGVRYLPYAYIGQSIGVFLWYYFMMVIINPGNENMERVTFVNGFEENFFEERVAGNCGRFILFNGVFSLVVISVCAMFLEEPNFLKGDFFLWVDYYFKNDKNAKKEFQKRFERMNLSKTIISITSEENEKSFNNSVLSKKSKSEYEFTEKDQKNKKLQNEIKKEIYSLKFIGFIIITTIKNTPSAIMIDCFKIMAQKIIKDDKLSSIIYCIVTFADIFGRFFVPYTWKKFGFYKTYLGNFLSDFFFQILFILYGSYNEFGLIICVNLAGLIWAFAYLLGHTTIFGLYRPIKAVGISKAFDAYYFFQASFSIFLTYLFIDNGRYRMCFVVCLIFEFGAGLVFFFFYEEFGDLKVGEEEKEKEMKEEKFLEEIELA